MHIRSLFRWAWRVKKTEEAVTAGAGHFLSLATCRRIGTLARDPMKRSEINALISEAKALLEKHGVALPPFAFWSPADWRGKGPECDEIRECRLGWDITDFGSGNFPSIGLVVFTVRNGHPTNPKFSAKTYCEKILIAREGQRTPMHFHALKHEDIISRSGGTLICKLYSRTPGGALSDAPFDVVLDGVRRTIAAGTELAFHPGESITLPPFLCHEFWAEPGSGTAILGEVSTVNNDATDNFFIDGCGRFPEVDEDEAPLHLLCTDYR
jgi:D-lyxose ketol-isomerase